MKQVCRLLEISRSGCYGWLKHKPSRRERPHQALKRELITLHEKYPALGLARLYRLLRPRPGCSRKRVHRQMRLAGVCSAWKQAYRMTSSLNHSQPVAANLLKRNFTFPCLDQAWGGDITCLSTGEGWLYLAIVKALCSRKMAMPSLTEAART